jgi:TetR/AcrR family transcriptional repressor of nem operon
MRMEKSPKRDAEKTRTLILGTSFLEIYRNSFQSVSVDQIVAKTGLTKGAFFHHFSSKMELGYVLADEFLRDMMSDRWIKPLRAYKDPVQGILACFKKNIVEMPEDSISCGCPLNNLCQEMSNVDPKFRGILTSVLTMWIEGTREQLERGKREGTLSKNLNTLQMAQYIVMAQEGAYGIGKTLRDRKVLQSMYNALKEHLEPYRVK